MPKCEYKTVNLRYKDWRLREIILYKCPHTTLIESDEDGKKYCIYHSNKEEKKQFYQKFKKLYKDGKHDFTGFVFPEDFDFKKLKKETGNLRFVDASFKRVTFLCKADFNNTEFNGEGKTSFYEANFSSRLGSSFHKAKFSSKSGTDFRFSRFSGSGEVSFYGVIFSSKGITSFNDAKFPDEWSTNFRDVQFSGDGEISFDRTRFSAKNESDFRDITFKNPRNVTFSGVDFNMCLFLGSNLRDINFKEVFWLKTKGFTKRRMVYDETFQLGPLQRFLKRLKYPYEEQENNHYEVQQLYNQLRINYENTGRYHEAGDFFVGAMEMRRRGNFEHLGIRAMLSLYKIISLYGERPLRAFMWILILILAASFLSLLVGIEPIQKGLEKIQFDSLDLNTLLTKDFWRDNLEGLYVTLNILTLGKVKSPYTIGHSIWGLILNTSVVVFGATFFSLFILAMNRKFRRTKD